MAIPIVEAELTGVPVDDGGRPADGIDISAATKHLATALSELTDALKNDASLTEASAYERQDYAKYLTIAKIKLENAIAVVRAGDRVPVASGDSRDE